MHVDSRISPLCQEIISDSDKDTFNFGKKIADFLVPGSVIALTGTLGSGKTILTKGIANGLGVKENITSPTFTIINEYKLQDIIFYHIDAYRLGSDNEFEEIGGLEIINSKNISVIEWSCIINNSLPAQTIHISMEITGLSSRLIKITGLQNI